MEKLVITGFGITAPNAYNVEHFRESLVNGEYGMGEFNSTSGANIIVGRVADEALGKFNETRYSRVAKLGLASAEQAIRMAGIPQDGSKRVTVIFGSASGPTEETVQTNVSCFAEDMKGYPTLGIGLMSYQSIASAVAGEFGLHAKVFTIVTGCNSGVDALFMAKLLLETDQTDICIVGGADAPLCEPVMYGFTKLRMLEADVESSNSGIPFSGRNKFIMSEGSATIVLEKESVANGRKTKHYGILHGVDTNNDGLSAYKSNKNPDKLIEVVQNALNGRVPTYIDSQALGLNLNDSVEMQVRDTLFGASVPLTSIKGVTGHPFGAIGLIQVISSLLAIEGSFIPKTKSNEQTRTLPIVTDTVKTEIETVCITSHGFGGNNGSIVIGKAG